MTLIGIALCGFLLLALVGTQAGHTILKGVGALVFGVIALGAVIVVFTSMQQPQPSAVASQSLPTCGGAAWIAQEQEQMRPGGLSKAEIDALLSASDHCALPGSE